MRISRHTTATLLLQGDRPQHSAGKTGGRNRKEKKAKSTPRVRDIASIRQTASVRGCFKGNMYVRSSLCDVID